MARLLDFLKISLSLTQPADALRPCEADHLTLEVGRGKRSSVFLDDREDCPNEGKAVGVETGENSRDVGSSEEREIRKLANRQPQGRKRLTVFYLHEERIYPPSKALSTYLFYIFFIIQSIYLLIVLALQLLDLIPPQNSLLAPQ